jgi:hypothetical protein
MNKNYFKLKSKEENPNGLHNKYVINRADGTPINPNNVYFILKLEGEGDSIHMEACRKAILKYAYEIENYLPELSKDILLRYENPDILKLIYCKHEKTIIEISWDSHYNYEDVVCDICGKTIKSNKI